MTGPASEVKAARQGWPERGGGAKAIRARARLARLLWTADGLRRLPTVAALDRALQTLPRGELEWVCELSPLGPLYLLPTRDWIRALARTLRELGVRRILEVAAGDGFLSTSLRESAPELQIVATDSGAWEKPRARMNRRERKQLAGTPVPGVQLGAAVERIEALAAVRKYRPELVLASWLPPNTLLEKLIRSRTKYVLDVGAADGVTGRQWTWRFHHTFCDPAMESTARCRLDERPGRGLRTRVTLYFGASHPEYFVERPRPGDWLWQFRPS